MTREDADGDLLVRRRGDAGESLLPEEASESLDEKNADNVLSDLHVETLQSNEISNGIYESAFRVRGGPAERLRHRLATPLAAVGLQVKSTWFTTTQLAPRFTEFLYVSAL